MSYSNHTSAASNQLTDRVRDGLMSACEGKRVQAMVPEAHQKLDKEIDSVLGLLNDLRQRINPVLRIEPCTGEKSPSVCAPPSSTVYEALNESARNVALARDKIQDMLRLIEL